MVLPLVLTFELKRSIMWASDVLPPKTFVQSDCHTGQPGGGQFPSSWVWVDLGKVNSYHNAMIASVNSQISKDFVKL